MSKTFEAYYKFVSQLEHIGLNLCAVFDIATLSEEVIQTLPDTANEDYPCLLLVGTKGSGFWNYLQDTNQTDGHAFDQVSEQKTLELLSDQFPNIKTITVYPHDDYMIPLQKLGHRVGWGRPSLLGLHIHADYGTWFAYRTALLVSETFPQTEDSTAQPVCEVCVDKPCMSACPVAAVNTLGEFNISACMGYRVKDNSVCADRCLSRLACPVGADYFYTPEHLAHHSKFSLASIKRFRKNNKW